MIFNHAAHMALCEDFVKPSRTILYFFEILILTFDMEIFSEILALIVICSLEYTSSAKQCKVNMKQLYASVMGYNGFHWMTYQDQYTSKVGMRMFSKIII